GRRRGSCRTKTNRVCSRTWTAGLDDDRRGFDDRLGYFHRVVGDLETGWGARMASDRLDSDRPFDSDGGAELRRAGRDDASRRRPVRLPARGVLSDLRFSVRMDAVHGDPGGDDRRGCRGLCPLLRSVGPMDFGESLSDSAGTSRVGLRDLAFYRTARWAAD